MAESNFKYIRAVTTIFFDEIADIRSRISEFDSLLGTLFNTPGVTYAIGETMPPAIPRLNYSSKFGHTSLDISCISAQMVTNLDGDFSQNFDHIRQYCSERESLIEQDIIRIGSKVRYVGFSLTAQLSSNKGFDPVKSIADDYFKPSALFGASSLHEAALKTTFEESKRYFVNIHINNFRSYLLQVTANQDGVVRLVNPSMKDFTEADSGLELTLDVNNKYMFDFINKDDHKATDFNAILDLSDKYCKQVKSGGRFNA